MNAFLDSPTASQCVLSLAHFLWQGVLIGVSAWLVSLTLRRRSAQTRYRLYTATLIVLTACPPLTFGWLGHKPGATVAQREAAGDRSSSAAAIPEDRQASTTKDSVIAETGVGVTSAEESDTPPVTETNGAPANGAPAIETENARSWWRLLSPWLLAAYVAGVLLMLMRLVFGIRGGARLRRESEPVTEGALFNSLAERSAALSIRAAPTLAWCRRVAVPTVVGVLRPTILLPLSLRSGMTPEQLSVILTHELAHIRRWDPLVNVLQRFVEALLFFHPVVWIVSRQMRRERENCCDDLVLATGNDPSGYAFTLLEIARIATTRDSVAAKPSLAGLVAMGANGQPSELGGRVRRLLGAEQHETVRLRRPGLALAGITTVLAMVVLMQLAVNADQDADDAPSPPAKATLPNGVEVELVGVGFHPSADRPWWKPDGSPLDSRPDGIRVRSSGPNEAPIFRIEIRGLPRDHAVTTRFGLNSGPGVAGGAVFANGLWVGDYSAGPFLASTTFVRIGIATEPLGPIQSIDAEGHKQELVGTTAEMKPLYDSIVPLRIEESSGGLAPGPNGQRNPGTRLVFDQTKQHAALKQTEWEMHAIDGEGDRHRSTVRSTESFVFPIARSRIARFEYRLRPYRYWVTFENVSLEPDLNTKIRVDVQAPETVSLDEWSRIIATRIATQLPFSSDTHRQRTATEFRQLVKTHSPSEPDPKRFRKIRAALDRHIKLEFPAGPYPGDPGSIRRDENYLKLPSVIRMLQWRLFMALQRSLDQDERSRLEEQYQWMRQFIHSLPKPPPQFDRDDSATNRALAKLHEKFQDPLRAVFHEPLSDDQFQTYRQAMEEFRSRHGDAAVLNVVHHLIGEYHRIAYRDREVTVPQLEAFDQSSHSLRIVSGRVQLGFHRAVSFRGRPNTVSDFYQHGILIALHDPTPGIVGIEMEGAPGRDGALDELDQWLAEGQDRGHLVFDEQAMRLIGVRGTRLVPLEQQRFYEVDALPTESLVEKIEQEGSQVWDLPEPVSQDSISGRKYDSLAAVLTGNGKLFVLQVQEHGPAGLRFHARRHHAPAGATAPDENASAIIPYPHPN